MEVVTGIWLGKSAQSQNKDWCDEHGIDVLLDCHRHFEKENPVELNYRYVDKIDEFCKKVSNLIYLNHCEENKRCFVVCENGRRISLLCIVYFVSTVCGVSKKRAYEIVCSKLPPFELSTNLARFIKEDQ